MNKIQEPSIQIENFSTLCCRACLMTDCRLYNIHDYKIVETFTRISGTNIMARDRLPQYLCAFCYMLLLKCSAFRDMCLRTQQLFKKMTADCIRMNQLPQRSLNLTQTEVETVEAPSDASDNESDEEMLVEALDEPNEDVEVDDMPTELFDHDSELDFVQVETSKKKNENILLKNLLHSIDQRNAAAAKNTVTKVENVSADKKVTNTGKEYGMKRMTIEVKNNILEFKVGPIKTEATKNIETAVVNVDSDKNVAKTGKENIVKIKTETNKVNNRLDFKVGAKKDKAARNMPTADKNVAKTGRENNEQMKTMTIEVRRSRLEFKVGDNDKPDNDDKVMVEKKKRKRRGKYRLFIKSIPISNFTVFDIKAFESKNNVKVAVLSKEEQLEEIALRKKTVNYLESPYRCESCGKGFELEIPYNNHRAKHSPTNGAHECDICGMRIKKRSFFKTHMNRHRFKFFCNICSFISRNQAQAKSHNDMHEGKTFECQYCGRIFNKKSTYFSHVRLVHPTKNVVCDECGETFVSEKGLSLHKHQSHVVRLQCDICTATFLTKEALSRHAELGEHSGLACEQCGDNCASEEELQTHVEETHPSQRCEECDVTFTSGAAFETHVQRKHVGRRYVGPPRPHPRRARRPGEAARAPRMCDQCGVTVPNAGQLMYHMRKHAGILPYSCPHCPKAFVARYLLKAHLIKHTDEKPFQCPDCPLAFKRKENLARHHGTAHQGIRGSFPCPVCGRASTTKASMKVHYRAVHCGEGWPKRNRPQHATTRKRAAQHSRVHPTTRNTGSDATRSDSDGDNASYSE